ncbi:BTB domain-containing protein [Mycena sanguinolenta]|uniref:BTB domain-containing protein n=1 Tax=Mycena sanguinolenta TaxID=230812 RepID=A0A8H6Z3W9_9AGAR|nr:BTB domain-containing protein [Mycena sanguinolenta]
MSADAETFTNAPPPFDDPNADIIIRSSENVDFRTHKLLLSLASSFFKEMFDIPQPVATDAENQQETMTRDGTPIIFLYDDRNQVCGKDVVDFILSCCHPARLQSSKPAVPTELLVPIVDVATRYRIDWAANTALANPHFLKTSPLLVFVHACHQGRAAEAALAAKETLRLRLDEFPSDPALKLISGYQYHLLSEFHRRCARAAAAIALAENLTTWITAPTLSQFPASHHPCSPYGNSHINTWNSKLGFQNWTHFFEEVLDPSSQQWWIQYMEITAFCRQYPRGVQAGGLQK